MPKSMLQDSRVIKGIYNDDWSCELGSDGITAIVPYSEHDGYLPWFVIYQGAFLWGRIDSQGLLIKYKRPTDA